MAPDRCTICCLPEDSHGPHGLVYKALYGWHTYTDGSGALTGAPPPHGPRRTATAVRSSSTARMSLRTVDPHALALYFGTDVARQVNQVRSAPLLPRRVPGVFRNPHSTPAPRPLPWWGRWRRILGGNR